jgi:3-oxoacyl-[acyl-carrier protein] reductase
VANPIEQMRVVLFSSITGQIGGAVTGVAYPTSKAAIMGLTRQAALDLAPYGILVNAVAPGSVATEEFKRFVDEPMIETLKARAPLRRISTPEEIANVVAFLLSDTCSYMTGTTIDVNGGALMR